MIPHLVEQIAEGNDIFDQDLFKQKVADMVKKNAIMVASEPLRTIVDARKIQRRMDSLARTLAPESQLSACLALAFFENNLIIACNRPKKIDSSELIHVIKHKISLLRLFLNCLEIKSKLSQTFIPMTLVFSEEVRCLALWTAKALEAAGGIANILPETRKATRAKPLMHLQVALLKIAEYYLLGLISDGQYGFSLSQIQALMQRSLTFILPTPHESLVGLDLHAEQALIHYLDKVLHLKDGNELPIGISKLACQSCTKVLSLYGKKN